MEGLSAVTQRNRRECLRSKLPNLTAIDSTFESPGGQGDASTDGMGPGRDPPEAAPPPQPSTDRATRSHGAYDAWIHGHGQITEEEFL